MKIWLNWKVSGPPTQLFHGGQTIKSPADLADTMNEFFIQKVQRLRGNIPEGNQDPLIMMREVMQNRDCQFTIQPVKPDAVLKIIQGLKNSKSTGLDNIDTYIIKLVAKDILPALTNIINLSIRDSCFPTSWKRAKVVPLLKKGSKELSSCSTPPYIEQSS